jgi:hypothetical protein
MESNPDIKSEKPSKEGSFFDQIGLMGKVSLEGIEFHAYHGVFKEETITWK